jgi:thiol-disulfide isomerase/thioredoxin
VKPRIAAAVLCLALGLDSSAAATAPGREIPGCELASLGDGGRRDPRQYRGQVLWLDFWASWCTPCEEVFPFLEDLQRELGPRGLRVLAVGVDEDLRDARAFLARHAVSFDVALDAGGKCARSFGLEGMPSFYLIDAQGVLRVVHRGFHAGDAPELRKIVEGLLAAGTGP